MSPGRRVSAEISASHLSAGRRNSVTADELVDALRSSRPAARIFPHVAGFFEELPIELVHDVILDEGLSYRHLHFLAGRVGAEGTTVEWLSEMASENLALRRRPARRPRKARETAS